jgi:AraC-like DNA-binding protein
MHAADMTRRTLDDSAWLRALDDGSLRLVPTLTGYHRGRLRLARHWDTSEQSISEHLVYACRGGRIAAHLARVPHNLVPGTICLVPPGVAFRFQAEAGGEPLLARFRFSALVRGGPVRWGSTARLAALDAALERLIDLIIDELPESADDRLAEDVTRAFCRAFVRARSRVSSPGRLGRDQLAALAAEVARRPCATGPRELAFRLGLSLDWASRLIRASTGLPPRTWILRERMRLACGLLGDGLPPSVVATRLGYRDPRLFGRQFRTIQGMTPGAWLRRTRRE